MTNITLTDLEAKALAALQSNCIDCTGSEMSFGIVEEIDWPGSRKQLGALLTTLQEKGVVEGVYPERIDGRRVTQFTLTEAYRVEPKEGN